MFKLSKSKIILNIDNIIKRVYLLKNLTKEEGGLERWWNVENSL